MITVKLLVFLFFVTSIPLAYTRHASLWGEKVFPDDVVAERHYFHQTHHVQSAKNKVDTQTNSPEIELIDVNENAVNSQSNKYQVQDQRNPEIQVVDVNGNVVNSDMDKYKVQDQRHSEIQVTDMNGNLMNHEVQDSKSGKIKVISKSPIPNMPIAKVSKIHVNTKIGNVESPNETTPKIEEDRKSDKSEISPLLKDSENEVDGPSYKVCKTSECKKLAKEFLKSLNDSVDPCENFYEFACGGWEASKPIPPYKLTWNRFSMVEDSVKRRLKVILETKPVPSDILPVRQAKKWYRSCMDTESLERRGLKPIESIMMQVGGWPMSMDEEEWHENEYTWERVERHYARLTGSYVFYEITADYPSEGYTLGDINIDAPTPPVSSEILQRLPKYIVGSNKHYRNLIKSVVKSFVKLNHASVSSKRILKEAQELVSFENEISELKRKDESTYYTTIEELVDWYNGNETNSKFGSPDWSINWPSVIQHLFDTVNIEVHPSTDVYVYNNGYVKGISDLLKRTPPRIIVNYIHWHFLARVLIFTTEEMRDIFSDRVYMKAIGIKEAEPRWLECLNEMKMEHASSYAFVKKHFTKRTESTAHEMIENIRVALQQNIESSNWLNKKSKSLAKEKLNSMKTFVGFPNWYNNKTAIINHYKGITIGAEYFDNSLSYMRYENKRILTRHITPKPEVTPFSIEDQSPITVNAFYFQQYNFAEFPMVDFQSPFFSTDFPNNVNYGIMGLLIGHEMAHGFDNCGIVHGKDGGKTQLSEVVLKSFYQRVNCFVDQFDEYHGNEKVVNGTEWNCEDDEDDDQTDGQKTAGENIADTTGLQAVFQAYKKFSKNKNPNGEMRLPGLERFADDQLFFLSFAEMWCEVQTPENAELDDESESVHSSTELRVIGALSNTKDFAEAFKCPIGSSMNPTNKCNIWNKPLAKVDRTSRRKNRYTWDKQWNS